MSKKSNHSAPPASNQGHALQMQHRVSPAALALAGSLMLPVLPLPGGRVVFPDTLSRITFTSDLASIPPATLKEGSTVVCVPILASTAVIPANSNLAAATISAPPVPAPAVTGDGLAEYGCIATIERVVHARLGSTKSAVVLVRGVNRARVDKVEPAAENGLAADVSVLRDSELQPDDGEAATLVAAIRSTAADLVANSTLPPEIATQLKSAISQSSPAQLTFVLAGLTGSSVADRIALLALDTRDRLAKVAPDLQRQMQVVAIADHIRARGADQAVKKQREAVLRKQMDAIRKELGNTGSSNGGSSNAADSQGDEVAVIVQRLESGTLPESVAGLLQRDVKRLQSMSPNMTEYHVLINYCETVMSLPWTTRTPDALDLVKARNQLDADHFGLDKVKKRVLEFLAVRKLQTSVRGPILTLYGPPGTGKTSIARSIAESMGRKFYRISLGGVRDESEIRGHRRTYVGAMPGNIVQALKRCGTRNPVILLDEIDKLGKDPMRGDPAGALLEVLDPEQNVNFQDHYVNIPFDLSEVIFIATCNDLSTLSRPLRDRMEIIELQGYAPAEKRAIARSSLLPKQLNRHGLPTSAMNLPNATIDALATRYTREAGVRGIERAIAALCRSVAMDLVSKGDATTASSSSMPLTSSSRRIEPDDLEAILGPAPYDLDPGVRTNVPGIVQGLAWNGTGMGAVLVIETMSVPGTGKVVLTGKLGDVLKESATLAITWLRAHAFQLGLVASPTVRLWGDRDVHVHLPAGAVPKDGPSAGVALATALVSLAHGTPVRAGIAMTGEITLRGDVLPVGGIKEKAVAAHLAGVHTILVPARNLKDLDEIPPEVRETLTIVPCDTLAQVLRHALEPTTTTAMSTTITNNPEEAKRSSLAVALDALEAAPLRAGGAKL
ncbi:Lon protease C-terminal proteolytic domain-containing protein [Blastocladiella britannica]|nr:Lon protease C-terminal proteolytic domain-containing protein [Blastocladiella britannica]